MAFSKWRGPDVIDLFTPSPSTVSESLPSIGSSTPRSLDDDLPFITPLSTLSARFETLDMDRTIRRFFAFQQPDPLVDAYTHGHHHIHPCYNHPPSEHAHHHSHIRSTPPAPIPRVSLERLHQFYRRHSYPPKLDNRNVSAYPNFINHTNSDMNHGPNTTPVSSARAHHSNPLASTSARARKAASKTSSAYQSKAADKCKAAAKARSKASSSRTTNPTPTASATAAGGAPTIPQAPATAASQRKQRTAKRRAPKNLEALAKVFTKCVRHYTDLVPGPHVEYFTTEELMYNYREVLDAWKLPPDSSWQQFARRYVTEDGTELYQCLLPKENDPDGCACGYGQTKAAMRRHLNDVHFGTRNWKCPFDDCNKSFKQRCTLKIHIFVRHTHETPYLCLYCEARFSDPAQRNKHYKCYHPDLEHPKRIKQAHDLPMDEADVYACFFCPERCADSRSRAIHCQEAHPDKFIPGVMVPAVSAMFDDEDVECDHEDGCDCEFN